MTSALKFSSHDTKKESLKTFLQTFCLIGYYDNTYKDFTRNNFAYNDNTYNT